MRATLTGEDKYEELHNIMLMRNMQLCLNSIRSLQKTLTHAFFKQSSICYNKKSCL